MDADDFEFQLRAEKEYAQSSSATKPPVGADPAQDVVMVWDERQHGFVPKVDEDFLASYLASYGVPQTEDDKTGSKPTGEEEVGEAKVAMSPTKEEKDNESTENTRKRKAEPGEPSWFDLDDEHNRHVYVSGLPPDVTMDEFTELMSKYGIIMEDDNGEPKIKLYMDGNGHPKGDGLCCYLKSESIELVLQILDQSNIRGHTITVERAKFQMKGKYNPSLKKKKKNDKKKKGRGQERLLDWRERRPESDVATNRKKHEKIIVFRHLFDPKEFEDNPEAITEIRDDLKSECEKFGVVKKVLIHDRHPEGVGTIAFKEFESADSCILSMQGRWYGGQQLEVSHWDGLQDFHVEETSKEREARLTKWEQFLHEGEPEKVSPAEKS